MLRNFKWLSLAIICVAMFAAKTLAEEDAKPPFVGRHSSDSYSFSLGDRKIFSYHTKTDGGFPYVHPLCTPDGTLLTEMAPSDHTWHRAVWFSWKFLQYESPAAGDAPAKLNRVNFWDWAQTKTGKPEGQTRPTGQGRHKASPNSYDRDMKIDYLHGDKLLIEEQRRVHVEFPRPDGSYAMDWTMTFTAKDTDITFERTHPKDKPWGGYGGFSYRANNAMKNQIVIDSEGRKGKEGHGKPAKWADFSGEVDGKAVGVAIFDHPDNPRHPTPWYVATGKMGYLNPAFLFHEPFTLPAGKSFTLKYRMLVHTGLGDPENLKKAYKAYAATK